MKYKKVGLDFGSGIYPIFSGNSLSLVFAGHPTPSPTPPNGLPSDMNPVSGFCLRLGPRAWVRVLALLWAGDAGRPGWRVDVALTAHVSCPTHRGRGVTRRHQLFRMLSSRMLTWTRTFTDTHTLAVYTSTRDRTHMPTTPSLLFANLLGSPAARPPRTRRSAPRLRVGADFARALCV